MQANSVVFQLNGEGAVLDACYTASGDLLATISTTGSLQVWSATTSEPEWDLLHSEELPSQLQLLSWADPEHGLVLAAATQAGAVHILQGPAPAGASSSSTRQPQQQQQHRPSDGWCVTGKLACGGGAISALAFAPRQLGLVLAVACQQAGAAAGAAGDSGRVLVFEAAGIAGRSLQWTLMSEIQLPRGAGGCRCMCWRDEPGVGLPPLMAVGHGKGVGVWAYRRSDMTWQELCSFSSPSGPTPPQALHWAPTRGRPYELLAAAFGGRVALFKLAPAAPPGPGDGEAQAVEVDGLGPLAASLVAELQHPANVWRVEWNLAGNMIAASLDDGVPEVWLWAPSLDGRWSSARVAAAPRGSTGGGSDGGDVDVE